MSQIHGNNVVRVISANAQDASVITKSSSPNCSFFDAKFCAIRGIAVSKKWLATSSDNEKIRVYDIEQDFKLIQELPGRKASQDGVPIANCHAIIFAGFQTAEEKFSSSSSSAAAASSSQQQQCENLPEFLIAPATKSTELVLYRTLAFLSSTSSDSAQQKGEKEEHHHHPYASDSTTTNAQEKGEEKEEKEEKRPWRQIGKPFSGLSSQIQQVIELPRRQQIAAVSYRDGMIWNIHTQEIVAEFSSPNSFYSISQFNSECTELICGSYCSKHISFWRRLGDFTAACEDRRIAQDVKLVQKAPDKKPQSLEHNPEVVTEIKFVSESSVKFHCPWRIQVDPKNYSFFLVGAGISAFSSQAAAANSTDRGVTCYDSATKEENFSFAENVKTVYVLSISPDGTTVFVGCQNSSIFFEVSSGKQVGEDIIYISQGQQDEEELEKQKEKAEKANELETWYQTFPSESYSDPKHRGKTCSCWCASWSSDSDIVYCGFDQGYCIAVENPLGMARWRRRKIVCLLRSIAEEGETSCSEKKEKEEERTKMESAMAIYRVAQITSSFIPCF